MAEPSPRQELITFRNHCRAQVILMRNNVPPKRARKAREKHARTLAQWEALEQEATAWLDRPHPDDEIPLDLPLMGV